MNPDTCFVAHRRDGVQTSSWKSLLPGADQAEISAQSCHVQISRIMQRAGGDFDGFARHAHSPSQRVLVGHSALHDDFEVLCWVADQVKIGNRIAVHQQHVGESACLDHAEFAGIRCTRA